jgi:hypothetical protein
VVIEVELGREDYVPIPCNCDWRGLKSFDVRTDPELDSTGGEN